MTLDQVLSAVDPLPDGFVTNVPEMWLQGRTAYGGFSSALALAAARQVVGNDLPLRSGSIAFIGPTVGRVAARATILRRGRNAVWVESRLTGDGGTTLTATFVFMQPAESEHRFNDLLPPADLIPVAEAKLLVPKRQAPLFATDVLEFRYARPAGTERLGDICWWVRTRPPGLVDPELDLILCGDGLPPAVLPAMPPGTRVSSMIWQCNLLTARPHTEDGWWLLRSIGDYAAHGCTSQRMQIWNSAGEPMVAGTQAIAIFA